MCSNHRKQVWRIYNCSPTLSVLSRRCPLPPALSPAPGAALLVGRALSYTIGEYTCQAQVARYKRAFLKAVLRQDVGCPAGRHHRTVHSNVQLRRVDSLPQSMASFLR